MTVNKPLFSKTVRKVIWVAFAIFLLPFVLGVLAGYVRLFPEAHGAEAKRWNPGIAPYATSREDACKKAPRAIDGFTMMPPAVKAYFKTTVESTCKGSVEKYITPDMLPEEMWSGGAHEHVMYHMPMAELSVLKAPDGHPYSKGSMFETAKAFQWTFVHEGKTYVLYLPWVCYNWTWMFGPVPLVAVASPQKQQEECAEDRYNTEEGEIVRFAVLGDEPLPPSSCWALKAAGDSEFRTPPVQCPDIDCDFSDIVAVVGMSRQHSGGYVAHKGENIFRFPAIVARNGARYMEVFCKQYAGRQTMGVGIRWVHYLGDSPKRAVIYDSSDLIPGGLSQDYDLAWRWIQ